MLKIMFSLLRWESFATVEIFSAKNYARIWKKILNVLSYSCLWKLISVSQGLPSIFGRKATTI